MAQEVYHIGVKLFEFRFEVKKHIWTLPLGLGVVTDEARTVWILGFLCFHCTLLFRKGFWKGAYNALATKLRRSIDR